MKSKLIKQIQVKPQEVNYFKLGLGGLISYMVACLLLVRSLYDWYLITSSTLIFCIIFSFMYVFFVRDKKLYIIKEGGNNENIKEESKLDKSKDIKEESRIKKVR